MVLVAHSHAIALAGQRRRMPWFANEKQTITPITRGQRRAGAAPMSASARSGRIP